MHIRSECCGGVVALIVVAQICTAATASYAGEAESAATQPERSLRLNEVVVTATRMERRLEDVAADVTVLTRADIEQSAAQTVDDFLRQVPGFNLFRRSSSLVAHPTAQGVSLRGIGASGASRTLVLLDGVPINDPFGGWVYWSKMPLESIERIEVVRGGAASVWGNYAMGGVINIITTHPTGRALTAVAEGGTHGTANMVVSGSERWGPLGLTLEGNYFRTDGYQIVKANQRGPIDINADSEHGTFNGKLEYSLSPDATLFLNGSFFDETRGNGTPLSNNTTDAGHVGSGAAFSLADGSHCKLTVFADLQTFTSTFSSQAPNRQSEQPASNQFDVPTTAVGAAAEWSKQVHAAHMLAGGADFRWIDGENNEDFRFINNQFTMRRRAGGTQEFVGAYVEDLFTPAERWLVSAAGRVDLWRSLDGSRIERSLQDGSLTMDRTFPDRNRGLFSPTLSVRYDATDRLAARAVFYQGFRAPTINELFRPFRVRNDITEANGSLDPERLLGGEAGLEYRAPTLATGLTAYWNDIRDPIANVTIGSGPGTVQPCGTVPQGGVCRQRQNLGRARVQGIEVDAEYSPLPFWSLAAGYLFSHTEVLSAPNAPDLEGQRLPQVPNHELTLKLGYTNAALLSAAVQVRYVGDQFEDDRNSLRLGDFAVVDFSLARRITRWAEVFFQIENLLDRTYEVGKTADGLITTGAPLLAHGGVRLQF